MRNCQRNKGHQVSALDARGIFSFMIDLKPFERSSFLGFLFVILLGACTFIPSVTRIGWLSDDYQSVYETPLRNVPTFHEMIRDVGFGNYQSRPSVVRTPSMAMVGVLGYKLGPRWCHVIQGGLHLLCGVLFLLLLRSLRWPSGLSYLAVSIFLTSAWITESVYWWMASNSVLSTIFILVAALSYLRWTRGAGYSRVKYLLIALFCIFAGLCCYEIWLPCFLLFLGIEIYIRCAQQGSSLNLGTVKSSVKSCWPTLILAALWIALMKMSAYTLPASRQMPLGTR